MKKKILTLCVVAALAVTAVAGASLAYLTDTDEKTNTFTIGKVQIELLEQQRGEDGLEEFENDKILLPLVGSANNNGEKDEYGLPTASNYVDKIVNVTNTGNNDAYVRVYIAVPSALDDTVDGTYNALHFNVGNKFDANKKAEGTENVEHEDFSETWSNWNYVGTSEINEIDYNVYSFTYLKVLAKDATTNYAAIVGFYLDSKVDNRVDEDGNVIYTLNGTDIDFDFSNGVEIPVFAIGVQADGFTDANTALNTAFGATYNPWDAE